MSTDSRMTSLANDVLQYVQEHPGATSEEIFNAMPNGTKIGTVRTTLGRLQRTNILENRGGKTNRFNPALWYAVEWDSTDQAREFAHDIFAEMMALPLSIREAFLAEKLDELFEVDNSTPLAPEVQSYIVTAIDDYKLSYDAVAKLLEEREILTPRKTKRWLASDVSRAYSQAKAA